MDGRARELDLIVYKVKSGKNVDVVTSLLISCKKDSEHVWTIMSRGRPPQDPNMDWEPVHIWTNNEVLKAYIDSTEWRYDYISGNEELKREIFTITRQAFAFQLVTIDGKLPKNDKPIFESLTDLMKAQDHELSILPKRIKQNRIYLFNLATIVDAPIYEVAYDEDPPKAKKIDEFRHLARYIVKKAELAARIHIINKDSIPSLVSTYNEMSSYNSEYFNELTDQAYASVTHNYAVQSVLEKKISATIRRKVNLVLRKRKFQILDPKEGFTISYDQANKTLLLHAAIEEDAINALNSDQELREMISIDIGRVLRYSGKFSFSEEYIPF